MEGCDAVEREVDRFTNRVKNVQNIFSTEVEKLCQHIEELKKEYGEGKSLIYKLINKGEINCNLIV